MLYFIQIGIKKQLFYFFTNLEIIEYNMSEKRGRKRKVESDAIDAEIIKCKNDIVSQDKQGLQYST